MKDMDVLDLSSGISLSLVDLNAGIDFSSLWENLFPKQLSYQHYSAPPPHPFLLVPYSAP